ncbi:MAG: SDR family oxidoreductase [Oscillospiraceae bacterium]|nr:SDR family oxidoreductase [Oscillospiraceae bacterium]
MKKVLITGASRGIGLAIAEAFAAEEYIVYANYRSTTENLQRLQDKGIVPVYADVTKPDDVAAMFAKIGSVDILVNNAGVSESKPFTDITLDDWGAMMSGNLTSVFSCTKAAVSYMISQKKGCIINVSSVWGEVGGSCEVHYSAAKAGVLGMTRALAKELGVSGIRVNAIAPGVIDTDMLADLTVQDLDELKQATPLQAIGVVKHIAQAALYLAKNDFVTGEILHVDGGFRL